MDLRGFFELATTKKYNDNGLSLLENKNEKLLDYKGDFELNGSKVIGRIEHKTNIRIENMDDFESSINAIDVDYKGRDFVFTGCVYKLNTLQLKVVKRSAYAKGTIHIHFQKTVEYHGQNCYNAKSGHCFMKCICYSTKKDYTEDFLIFIRIETYRSQVMTSARIQPFCRLHNINIGCFNARKTSPGTITARNIALKTHT